MRITQTQLLKRVEQWADRLALLGVSHWEIKRCQIVDEIEFGGTTANDAAVRWSNQYDQCEFMFSRPFLDDCDYYELDQTIIHEWLHVAMRDLMITQQRVESWMTPAGYNDWSDALNHEVEGLVERLAANIMVIYHSPKAKTG